MSMFVYIDLASQVNRRAVAGKGGRSASFLISWVKLEMKASVFRPIGCSCRSAHLPSPSKVLPLTEIIGLVFSGSLCTFAVM